MGASWGKGNWKRRRILSETLCLSTRDSSGTTEIRHTETASVPQLQTAPWNIHFCGLDEQETPDMGEGCRRVNERALELNLTSLLAPKNEETLMRHRFVCTKNTLFQIAITCGMIKPTALEIALNSIKSSATGHYFGARKRKDGYSSSKGMRKKMIQGSVSYVCCIKIIGTC